MFPSFLVITSGDEIYVATFHLRITLRLFNNQTLKMSGKQLFFLTINVKLLLDITARMLYY